MAPIWIEAALARQIAANGGSETKAAFTICERAHDGLIRAKAKSTIIANQRQAESALPEKFWWARGYEALEQDWSTGDFSTWIDKSVEIRAYGVCFALEDILEILPFELRAHVARRYSVEGHPMWYSAREARAAIAQNEKLDFMSAGGRLIELAKLGFVTARAVEMRSGKEFGYYNDAAQREWNVPIWFWREYIEDTMFVQKWELGLFRGCKHSYQKSRCIELSGVHFLKSTVVAQNGDEATETDESITRPALSGADLTKWWEGMAASRDLLTQDQLLTLLRAKFPDKHIARDRIRDLSGGRKPGPKGIGG